MKRPSFQFYPADWTSNSNLRRCSRGARGVWMDVICALHDSDEYGVIRWPLKDIAATIGCPLSLLKELVDKNVLKGSDKKFENGFSYERRINKTDTETVVLIGEQDGPLWFSSRLVRDEHIRNIRARGGEAGKDHGTKGAEFGHLGGRPKKEEPDPASPAPARPPRASPRAKEPQLDLPEPEWPENLTTATTNDLEAVKRRIDACNPHWQKNPHWTQNELRALFDDRSPWLSMSDDQWKVLTAYMHAKIPDEWRENKKWDFVQPDNRTGFVRMGPTSLTGHADKWRKRCNREGKPTGIQP